ncbi:hypothetical protein DPSP01_011968 [Paraphaeosphaeria sporulosa]|uniref:Uncharacterized protein n=1 Tax=Paraphaeosphaeria sporulosa TaxID=1460663 RepID=A0A177CWW6_9PLEO|nr:uncharacterized protein CC84DRAFT_1210890 [Paraphaeosphaeria sporulosa]OAG11219.1 hypothetical protein CC84DRAFT_1210890 [Paraphaeosphaeria sporulosa]
MADQKNRTWIPEDSKALRYSNCTSPSAWLVEFIGSMDLLSLRTVDAIFEGYDYYWRENNITKPKIDEVLNWVLNVDECDGQSMCGSHPVSQIIDYAFDHCQADVCRGLPWQGNADQAGRGMIFAYGSQAVLVTIYLIILFISRISKLDSTTDARSTTKTGQTRTLLRRIHDSARETLRTFLDASLLFSIAMIIAAIVTANIALASVRKLETEHLSTGIITRELPLNSTVQLSAFAALLSIFPAIALHSSASSLLRRKVYRQSVWILVGVLVVLMFVLSRMAGSEIFTFHDKNDEDMTFNGKALFENLCIDNQVPSHLRLIVLVFFISLSAFGSIYILSMIPWIQKHLEKIQDALSSMMALFATIAMWIAFGAFYYYRKQVEKNAGETNENHKWTFGQVIGLCTFAPIVVEFLFVLVERPEKALTGTMSKRFQVNSVKHSIEEEQTYTEIGFSDEVPLRVVERAK